MAPTALVLVAHSTLPAQGSAQVAAQMAPDVVILPAGGLAGAHDDDGLGTSYDLVERQVRQAFRDGAVHVVLITDLGSATLTAQSVAEMLDDDRILVADAPFVEGAVAAAVTAQGGANGGQVLAAAEEAAGSFRPPRSAAPEVPPGPPQDQGDGQVVRRTVELRNRHGLHARPAAMVARRVGEFDARVWVNGVDATSVLALMGLGLTRGARVELQATGPHAAQVIEMISADVEAGFGEE